MASRPRGETEYLGVEGYRGFQPRLANKRGHNDLIACIIYLENSGRYVTAGRDGIVCVWDETEKNNVRRPRALRAEWWLVHGFADTLSSPRRAHSSSSA